MGAAEQRQVERWFVRRGLPHFIEGYSAGTDIWTRSLPVLVVAYVALGLNALRLGEWSVAANLAAFAGLLAILVATWVLANVVRRRPAFSRPRVVGPAELAVFLLGPVVAALALGNQGRDALLALFEGVVVLGLVYVGTSYGIVPMTQWAVGRIGGQLAALGQLLARALPLLTLTITFLFVNAEVWEVTGTLRGLAYWFVLGGFVLIGVVFVTIRIPREVGELGRFPAWADVVPLLDGTPCAGRAGGCAEPPPTVALTRRQWLNVGLVMLISQGVQVLLVVAVVFAFITAFGFLAVKESTVAGWTGGDPNVLVQATLSGRSLVITEELLRVAGFLATFAGLNFTVYVVTDTTYRAEFREEVVAEIRQAFAVREIYLAEC